MDPTLPPLPGGTDLHAYTVTRTAAGFHATCACGEWEGWFSGPGGQRYVVDDHNHHRRAASNGANTPPVQ